MIIDAKNSIVGRIATVAAKRALLGEDVKIINCSQACITGSRDNVLAKYKRKRAMGIPTKGPFYPKSANMIIRRIVRGMLPHRQEKGRTAFERIRCYNTVPEDLKEKAEKIEGADISKIPNLKYIRLDELQRLLGAKE